MEKKFIFLLLSIVAISLSAHRASSQTCNTNTYLNSGDASSIEYDNMVSGFHSSIIRESDGVVRLWGQGIDANGTSHVLTPKVLNSTNFSGLTGSILKFTMGSTGSTSSSGQQFAVLTTDGLFVWGGPGNLISTSIKSTSTFAKVTINSKADGLPAGVSPGDVKMMFGTYHTLAIVTNSGAAYVLSQSNNMRGRAAGQNWWEDFSKEWYQVKTGTGTNDFLTGVVALRGCPDALVALTTNGVYTWGDATRINSGGSSGRNTATLVGLPTGVSAANVKMIGMTRSGDGTSYYLLTSSGALYAMGENGMRQLGTGNTSNSNSWVRPQKTSGGGGTGNFDDVVWISPNEHDDGGQGSINVLTTGGKLWAWGGNERNMLGIPGEGNSNPVYMPGGLNASSDNIYAVETGGHTTMIVKQCSGFFGYVGHRINGSMANGLSDNGYINTYSFSTSGIDLCGASSGGAVIQDPGQVYNGQTYDLNPSPAPGTLSVVSGSAYITGNRYLHVTGKNSVIKVKYVSTAPPCGGTVELTLATSLMVSFGSVDASYNGNALSVNWTTLHEENNDHFEVEISSDGTNFTKLGEVASKANSGNAATSLDYNFRKEVSAGMLGIGFALLALGGMGLGFVRRRKMIFGMIILAGMATMYAGCNKNDALPTEKKDTKVYVRVVQVDKDGTKTFSKVVKAVNL